MISPFVGCQFCRPKPSNKSAIPDKGLTDPCKGPSRGHEVQYRVCRPSQNMMYPEDMSEHPLLIQFPFQATCRSSSLTHGSTQVSAPYSQCGLVIILKVMNRAICVRCPSLCGCFMLVDGGYHSYMCSLKSESSQIHLSPTYKVRS
jgi:hypothetical protein